MLALSGNDILQQEAFPDCMALSSLMSVTGGMILLER